MLLFVCVCFKCEQFNDINKDIKVTAKGKGEGTLTVSKTFIFLCIACCCQFSPSWLVLVVQACCGHITNQSSTLLAFKQHYKFMDKITVSLSKAAVKNIEINPRVEDTT